MKKILLPIFVLICGVASSQDTTIAQLSCKARLVQTLVPYVKESDDTAYINLLYRWRAKYAVANPPSGTTLVVVDSISVKVIAGLYDKAFKFPQGALAVGSDFAADIAAIRAANTNLDRLLDAIDLYYSTIVSDARTRGRKLLTGNNQ